MSETIPMIRPFEPVEFDHDTLAALCDRHRGDAEAVIAGLLAEIEAGLRRAASQFRANDPAFARTIDDLHRLADEVGMRTLRVCTEAIRDQLAARDRAALEACAWRMFRLADPATMSDWQVCHDTVA
ncbi:hypothetical protein ACK8OR_17460 [Jannaschia sp. KMU-145]|uniref:hypothetical protein n=1 Tax=Jannaschia halovivens TaxID=3388667 RepID=UPI00396B20FA